MACVRQFRDQTTSAIGANQKQLFGNANFFQCRSNFRGSCPCQRIGIVLRILSISRNDDRFNRNPVRLRPAKVHLQCSDGTLIEQVFVGPEINGSFACKFRQGDAQ